MKITWKISLVAGCLIFSFFVVQKTEAATLLQKAQINNLSLVGYWTFDGADISNGVMLDRSGSGKNANIANIASSTFYTIGKTGQAGNYDGVNDRLIFTGDVLGTGAITVSAWLNARTLNSAARIISNTSGNTEFSIDSTNNRLLFYCGSNVRSAVGSLTVNTWKHVLVTRDASGVSNIYVDGNLSGTADQSCGTPGSGSAQTSIGNATSGSAAIDGMLDNVRVYGRVLSNAEIKQLYYAGLGTKQSTSPSTKYNSGLVGYWSFNGADMTNGVALDRSGNNNNGSLFGIASSTFYTAGKIGQAGNFDGSNDYVDLASQLVSAVPWTMCGWGKLDVTTGDHTIFGMSDGTAGVSSHSDLRVQGGVATMTTKGTGVTGTVSGQTVAVNEWHHYCGTEETTSLRRIYVDGVLGGTDTTTVTTSGINDAHIGAIPQAGTSIYDPWIGVLDDVRLYNRVLSATEVKQLYLQGVGTHVNTSLATKYNSGLLGYWSFNGADMTNGVALDRSGNGKNGNLVNIATSTFYSIGRLGQGLNFDGVNDIINTGADYLGTSDLTISAWIYPHGFGEGGLGMIINNSQVVFGVRSGILSLQFRNANNTLSTSASNSMAQFNKWYFVTATRSGTSINFYIDSVLSGSANQTNDTPVSGSTVYIGNRSATDATFDGIIDEVRIYSMVLSLSEIKQLYLIGR